MRTKPLQLTLLVLILTTLTIGATHLLFTPTSPSTPIVSVSPTTTTAQMDINQTFTVNVTITDSNDLYVWQAGMTFNATILEALSLVEGPLLKESGTTLWVDGTINNTAGTIHYHACALAGNVTGASGNGTLGTITFKVRNYGNSTLQLIEVLLLDSTLKDIDKTPVNGTVEIRIPGDVNGDSIVEVVDLATVGKAYGASPDDPNWNPAADINGDDIIDTLDLEMLQKNYGKTT